MLSETPYYSTLNFKFDGNRLLFDSEHNVAFGPTKLPQLIGVIGSSTAAERRAGAVKSVD